MKRRTLTFTAPRRIEILEDDVPTPSEKMLLVRTASSAISAGTELLLYRGDIPEGLVLDEGLPAFRAPFHYPASYGYAAVGEVVGIGAGADRSWMGKTVFSFQPHTSHFLAAEDALYPIPEGVTAEAATHWPMLETAVNLVLDAQPLVGERVLVVGQGVVGLAATKLLARFPLALLWSVDPFASRRQASLRAGASRSLGPDEMEAESDFDLSFELSGTAAGLNVAIAATGFEGRVVIGSWYGAKRTEVDLGTHFHRGRLRLVSSQVSHLGSPLLSRWSKKRRMDVAGKALSLANSDDDNDDNDDFSALITHRFPLERASEAYALLDEHPEDCLQVLLAYT